MTVSDLVENEVSEVALRLAERVKELRLEAGLTQADLAAHAGITVETVARLERVVRGRPSANANPSLDTLIRLSIALGVEVSDLLGAGRPRRRPTAERDALGNLLVGADANTRRRVLRVAQVLLDEEGRRSRKGDSNGARRKKSRSRASSALQ